MIRQHTGIMMHCLICCLRLKPKSFQPLHPSVSGKKLISLGDCKVTVTPNISRKKAMQPIRERTIVKIISFLPYANRYKPE